MNDFKPGGQSTPVGEPSPLSPNDLPKQYAPLPAGQGGEPARAVPEGPIADFMSFQAVLLRLGHKVDAVIDVHSRGLDQLRKSQDDMRKDMKTNAQ